MLAHAGIFNVELTEYYYTLSDNNFEKFTVMYVRKEGNKWSDPEKAFFNTEYKEHGVHFTQDGKWVYFSSTRPVGIDSIPNTWHIWRCKKDNEKWSLSEFVHLPGLEQKLVSHPSLSANGKMYFHVANTDYSNMSIYVSEQKNGVFGPSNKLHFPVEMKGNTLTPFIAPDDSYLLFVNSSAHEYAMYISHQTENKRWSKPQKLNEQINQNNKGNPYVTPDGKSLFFASGTYNENDIPQDWIIKSVSTKSFLNEN